MISFWTLYLGYAFFISYVIVGFIVSFETSAAMSGGKFAIKWIREHFSYTQYYYSVIFFYPMILFLYFFLEILPCFIRHEIRCQFNLQALFNELFNTK